MMMKFMQKMDHTVEGLTSTVNTVKSATEQNTASIRILEGQMGQIADAMNSRNKGQFPSQPEIKPRDECKAIHLRSGKQLEEQKPEKNKATTVVKDDTNEEQVDEEIEMEKMVEFKDDSKQDTPKPTSKPVATKIPYPNRLKSHKDNVEFAKFLEVFKKLHINIPFADAFAQMPSYVKFLKDILSNKRKLEEHATVALTEECNAILQNKIPKKLKDPGSFTIHVQIGNSELGKALCDLGSSINLMPLSIFRKLGLKAVQPTNVTLQLADRSIKYRRSSRQG